MLRCMGNRAEALKLISAVEAKKGQRIRGGVAFIAISQIGADYLVPGLMLVAVLLPFVFCL